MTNGPVTQSKEDVMVQYLELMLKRDLATGWRRTAEKVKALFEKTTQVDPKEEIEGEGWKDKYRKNTWYY
jgi:hypothetical protein